MSGFLVLLVPIGLMALALLMSGVEGQLTGAAPGHTTDDETPDLVPGVTDPRSVPPREGTSEVREASLAPLPTTAVA